MMYLYIAIALLVGLLLGKALFGKKAAKRRKIYNGMIPCQIYMYFDRPVKPVRK